MYNKPQKPQLKDKFRFFTLYKWGTLACFILAVIFLFVGIMQTAAGSTKVEALKPNFENLSSDSPTNTKIEDSQDIGVEYVGRTGRRSTTTYNYVLIKVLGKKIILETTDKDEIKAGSDINLKKDIASITAENQTNLRSLAQKNITKESLKISPEESTNILILKHYTDSDKLGSDYWGWIAFVVFLVASIVFGIRYWWEKRNYKIAFEDGLEIAKAYGQVAPQVDNSAQPYHTSSQNNHEYSNQNIDFSNNNPNNQSNKQREYSPSFQNSHSQNYNQNGPIQQQIPNTPQNQSKTNKTVYILLAIFFGIFGVHHFYEGKVAMGLFHLSWLVMFIIGLFNVEQLGLITVVGLILLPIVFIVSLIQAIIRIFRGN